jgi:CRISPR-associated protein Csm1
MTDNYDIALAALIHDIGKIESRSGVTVEDSMVQQVETIWGKLGTTVEYNALKSQSEKLISTASMLSAGIDSDEDLKDRASDANKRLYSIFQDINIGKQYKGGNYYYKLVPLTISDDIFPIGEELLEMQELESEYIDLLKLIKRDIKREQGQDNTTDIQEGRERTYNKIYYILEKYTTFVPYSISGYSDVSLFEHLKTTSAIATCLKEYCKNGAQDDNKFILLAGDVSGIQNFIYQVTEGVEIKKDVSKSLRGKSFYVNVLIDFMSKYIVRELGLTISNILYCGGGTFQILLPNTEETKKQLSELEQGIQKYLYSKYKTRLGLVLAYIEIDDKGIKNYAHSITKLQEEVAKSKNQKFLNIIDAEKNDFFIREKKIQNICIYCHEQEATIGGEICTECSTHINLGENLVKDKLKYIVYDFEKKAPECDVRVDFGAMGQVCFYSNLDNMDVGFMTESINGTGKFGRTKFVGNTVPVKRGVVASFNDIGPLAEGDNNIAVLKMDIDNLGTIFSAGFEDENKSIAKTSTLSRMIDLFFCGYINKICEDLYNEYIKINNNGPIALDNLFYINFSGGDDLVIIGPWDWTITLARRIKEELSRFSCYNPNMTISSGIYIADPKTPVRITLYEGEKYLERAKDREGKDSICIFEEVFSWKDDIYSIDKVVEDGNLYAKWIKRGYMSRGLIYNIMVGSKNINRKGNLDFDLIPHLAYSLSRNIQDEKVKRDMMGRLVTPDIKDSEIEFIKYPLMFALMKTRDVEED